MQRSILKNIIIATLPIFAYIIADSIFKDSITSLIIAILISVTEFIISLIINKKVDLFIFFDLLLISSMGLISIYFKNPIFFKLKPALIEAALVFFIIPLCFSSSFLKGYLNRYLKNIQLSDDKIKMMQKNIYLLLPVIIIHIVLIIISALYFSKEIWAFISGFLLYIIFIVIFAGIFLYKFLYNKYSLKKYKNEEWFDIVTEDGKVIGKAPRAICHNGSKLLHPVVHVHIFNSQNKLLLQKRSITKDIQPGKWDTSVGGHLSSGENITDALKREVLEEAGLQIDLEKIIPLSKYVFESDIEKELSFSFAYKTNEKIKFQESEIDEVKFYSKKEIEKLIEEKLTTGNFIKEFNLLKDYERKGIVKF